MLRNVATVLGVLAVVLVGAGVASAAFLSIVDVGAPPTYTNTYAYGKGLNDSGEVAVTTGATARAFHKSGSTWTDIGVLDATQNYSATRYINNSGDVAGFTKNSSGNYQAFVWNSTGGRIDLGSLGGASRKSYGHGINASGLVIGYSEQASSTNTHGCAWTSWSAASIVDLGTLPGGTKSGLYAVNDSGQMVGYSTSTAYPTYGEAVMYSGTPGSGSWTAMGTLGGSASIAYGLNASGHVVGYSRTSATGNPYHGFLWRNATEGMIDLGFFPGTSGANEYSVAQDISDSGQIVGYVKNTSGAYLAAMYTGTPGSGTWVDLNTLIDPASGWVLTNAYDINNSGQIFGHGTIGGATHAFILTIPEPSTLALLATGLIGLLAYAWRKRK